MKRRKHSSAEIYEEISSNLVSCWITLFVMGILFLGSLAATLLSGIGYDTILLIFSTLILVQAIRGIFKLRVLKGKVQENPESARMSDVLAAPSIKGIYVFVW